VDRVGEIAHLVAVGDIDVPGEDTAAEGAGARLDLGEACVIDVAKREIGPAAGRQQCGLTPDAAPGSGDEDRSSVQVGGIQGAIS
jgi:hypothetical protein